MRARISLYVIALGVLAGPSLALGAGQVRNILSPVAQVFRVTSTTFPNDGTIPLSMLGNNCNSPFASPIRGGNASPQLSWTRPPHGTRSFVVIAYDVTAAFTYWGMYNINTMASAVGGLPENAGVAGSSFGEQVANDVGNESYDGPCQEPLAGPLHTLVFTVYALDIELPELPSYGDFPANAETLYRALIDAGRGGHILASASIGGFFAGGK